MNQRTYSIALGWLAILAAPAVFGANYTFTKIVDNAPGSGFSLFVGPTLINNQGVVAFTATRASGQGIFAGSGGAVTTLWEDSSGGQPSASGLNDAGTVVYYNETAVYTVAAGAQPFLVADRSLDSNLTVGLALPTINNKGTVVIPAQYRIYTRTGSDPVQTLVNDTELPRANVQLAPMIFGGPINNAGAVAFYATLVDNSGANACQCEAYTKAPGALTAMAPFPANYTLAINDSGAVAFAGRYLSTLGVFVANGGKVATAVDIGNQASATLTPGGFTMNNKGQVAYLAQFGVSPRVQGIFTGKDPVADRVIGSGDPLFGSTVMSIGTIGQAGKFLNDNGQVAFSFTLTNGLRGIAVATPVASSTPPPSITANGILNAASFSGDSGASPGSVVSIFGANFIDQLSVPSSYPLPTSVNGVSVTFNGIPSPLFFVAPGQINAQVPYEISGPTASVQVTTAAGQSETRTVNIVAQSPAIYTTAQTGSGQGVVVFGNTATVVGPVTPGKDWRPAHTGDTITLYVNGLGAVTPTIANGSNSCERSVCAADLSNLTLRQTSVRPTVEIGGVTVPDSGILFAGLAPQFVGLYQINVTIPSGIRASNQVPIVIHQGKNASPSNVWISMQ